MTPLDYKFKKVNRTTWVNEEQLYLTRVQGGYILHYLDDKASFHPTLKQAMVFLLHYKLGIAT